MPCSQSASIISFINFKLFQCHRSIHMGRILGKTADLTIELIAGKSLGIAFKFNCGFLPIAIHHTQ